MSRSKIRTALQDRVDELAASASITIEVAHQNSSFKPTKATDVYWTTNILEVESTERSMFTTFQEELEGLFQITVFSPAGKDTTKSDISMNLLDSGFIAGDQYSYDGGYVEILRMWQAPKVIDGSHFMEPYTIRWSSWINRTTNN